MRRTILLGMAALALFACRPAAKDQRSAAIPQADTPASPSEPASAPASSLVTEFGAAMNLVGAEPPWTLKIRRDSLALSRPGRVDVMSANPGPTIQDGAAVWETTAVGAGGPLKVTLKAAPCSVDMQDKEYAYQATVESGGESLKGCAEPAG